MKTLVLAEKPSVAKEIARVLGSHTKHKSYFEGPQYVVTWALGHLITLAEPEDYNSEYKNWKLEDLPIIPERMKLKVIKETSHQYRAIEQLCKRSDLKELVIATDAGREGELVARWIMEKARWTKPFKRLWISSQTDRAIKDGFANLKPGKDYNRLYQSAVCRSEADWLIGLNITRALTSKYNAQLSAGRVQTPTLAMMIQREKDIRSFQPVEYKLIQADLGSFQVTWRDAKSGESRLFDLHRAAALLAKLKGKDAVIKQLKQTEKQIPQPLAYDLTELQRDANKRYGFSAKQTSNLLQRLYEQYKLVTYPRTDSRYLTSDMAPTLKGRLSNIAIGPYAAIVRPLLNKPLAITKQIVDDSKVTDHHAIIPTEERPQLTALSSDERKLYDLIVKRFISLFYPACRYDQTTVVVDIAGESFHASGKVMKLAGWKEVYQSNDLYEQEQDSEEETNTVELRSQSLPPLQVQQKFTVKQWKDRQEYTKPPGRYNEASLLSQMEKHNLGTPATRADIIEKLLNTDTIERQGNQLVPTGKGLQLIDLAAEQLRSAELTAKWEKELERIANGKGSMTSFLDGIRAQTVEMVQTVKASTVEYKPHNLTHSKCPECQTHLQEIKGKRGTMLVCSNRECTYKRSSEPPLSNRRCPQCRKKMEIHNGKAGKYFQCRRCNVIEKLDGQSNSRVTAKQNQQLIKQFGTDEAPIGNSLADALKAAMNKKDS